MIGTNEFNDRLARTDQTQIHDTDRPGAGNPPFSTTNIVQSCRLPRSTIRHHYSPGLETSFPGLWPPDLLYYAHYTTLADVHTHVPLSHPQALGRTERLQQRNSNYLDKSGLSLLLTWLHGVFGTWVQCLTSVGLTTRYQISITGCRNSSIRCQKFTLFSSIMDVLPLLNFQVHPEHTERVFHGCVM